MFDPSLLLNPPVARKAGALAASFTAQFLIGGVLLIAPLLYRESLAVHLQSAADYFPLQAAQPARAAPTGSVTRGHRRDLHAVTLERQQ